MSVPPGNSFVRNETLGKTKLTIKATPYNFGKKLNSKLIYNSFARYTI